MNYYRCYLLDGDDHIASAKILKCRDDHDAKQQCRDVLAASDRYAGAEIWDSARYVYRYPEDTAAVTAETLHRKDQMGTRDQALSDALSAQLAADRRCMLEADAVKAARLREQCLERHAQIERLMRRGFLGTRTRRRSRRAMFDQERGEKCGWCNAQDEKIMPCAKLDEVGRRIVLRTDREACKLEICAHYPEMISYA